MFDELEDFIHMLHSTRAFLRSALKEISEDRFDWSPTFSTSSTEMILKHVGKWETTYISRIQFGDDRAVDHSIELCSGQTAVLEKLEEIREWSLEAISQLKPEDMQKKFDHNGNLFNTRKMLINWTRHETYHIGQIFYIAMQLNPDQVNELPDPPRIEST